VCLLQVSVNYTYLICFRQLVSSVCFRITLQAFTVYRHTVSINKLRGLSWVCVQEKDVGLELFVLQIVCHSSHSCWGILHLGAEEIDPKHVFILSVKYIQLTL
jgi:hypothetical protein